MRGLRLVRVKEILEARAGVAFRMPARDPAHMARVPSLALALTLAPVLGLRLTLTRTLSLSLTSGPSLIVSLTPKPNPHPELDPNISPSPSPNPNPCPEMDCSPNTHLELDADHNPHWGLEVRAVVVEEGSPVQLVVGALQWVTAALLEKVSLYRPNITSDPDPGPGPDPGLNPCQLEERRAKVLQVAKGRGGNRVGKVKWTLEATL